MIVITTFYNASKYIDKCIKSLIDQSFKDFKFFLITKDSNPKLVPDVSVKVLFLLFN